jgi:hypothetical protein
VSGGVLLAQVFTVDDPGFEQAHEDGLIEVEANTFPGEQPGNVLHYFEKDELPMLFPDLKVLQYSLERVIAPNSEAGYRSGAALAAQRPVETRSGS